MMMTLYRVLLFLLVWYLEICFGFVIRHGSNVHLGRRRPTTIKIPTATTSASSLFPPCLPSDNALLRWRCRRKHSLQLLQSKNDDDDDDEDDDDEDLLSSEEQEQDTDQDANDWKAFQEQLIAKERSILGEGPSVSSSSSSETKPSPSSSQRQQQETYDWKIREIPYSQVMPGSLLLSTLPNEDNNVDEDDETGYGLGRQYLHKAIILILERTNDFVSGIILNRGPYFELGLLSTEGTILPDSETDWIVYFGGDTYRIDEETKEEDDNIMTNTAAIYVQDDLDPYGTCSREIVSGVYMTTHWTARDFVHEGLADPNDFWLFYGHVHWSNAILEEELQDGLWTCATMTSPPNHVLSMIRSEMQQQQDCITTNPCGTSIWNILRKALGKSCDNLTVATTATKNKTGKMTLPTKSSFDDQMLEEWALKTFPLYRSMHPKGDEYELSESNNDNDSTSTNNSNKIRVGSMLRGTASTTSGPHRPFLLSNQEHYKSLILLLQDDDNVSVGILLNLPSTKMVDLPVAKRRPQVEEPILGSTKKRRPNGGGGGQSIIPALVSIVLRFGGTYDFAGTSDVPLIFLHRSQTMKEKNLGTPIGHDDDLVTNGIWRCDLEEVTTAVSKGYVTSNEIMAINGFCIWKKEQYYKGITGGIKEEMERGNYESIPTTSMNDIWNLLLQQQQLATEQSVEDNIRLSNRAWNVVDNYAEKEMDLDESLADQARRRWVKGFLLEG